MYIILKKKKRDTVSPSEKSPHGQRAASDRLLPLMLVARSVFRVEGHGVHEARTSKGKAIQGPGVI